jgi:hypothetical protein
MSDLRTELDAVLRAVEPGPPPVEAAMRRGRRLRSRRRLTALAGAVAAVALVAAGYQVLPHSVALKATVPAASQPAGITVVPGSTAGVVATGTVNGTHWQLSVSRPTARGQCFTGTVGTGSLGSACDLMPRSATTPASLQVLSNDSYTAMIIGVAPDVRYVVLTTADRKELRLVPVTVGASGDRFIGLVLPHDFNVTSGPAYLTDGKHVAVAPNTPPGWTRPGENSPPAGNASLGLIMADGQQWLVSAEEGPWGTCVGTGYTDYPSVLSCTTVAPLTALAAVGVANVPAGSPTIVYGSAPPAATSLTVRLTNGHSLHVHVHIVGTEKLWAFALGKGQAVRSWTAYNASGKPLGTGGCASCKDG